jgi:hypothetical protein
MDDAIIAVCILCGASKYKFEFTASTSPPLVFRTLLFCRPHIVPHDGLLDSSLAVSSVSSSDKDGMELFDRHGTLVSSQGFGVGAYGGVSSTQLLWI